MVDAQISVKEEDAMAKVDRNGSGWWCALCPADLGHSPAPRPGPSQRRAQLTLGHARTSTNSRAQFVTSFVSEKKMDIAGEAPMIATAMEFMARASSTSEVLTLNLTNLLILLVLKALIFGFGLFSVGGAGRSLDGPSVSQSELTGGMCFLMYTSGDESKFDCVQRTVCEDPYLASDYLTAAKMWYKMHNMLKS